MQRIFDYKKGHEMRLKEDFIELYSGSIEYTTTYLYCNIVSHGCPGVMLCNLHLVTTIVGGLRRGIDWGFDLRVMLF